MVKSFKLIINAIIITIPDITPIKITVVYFIAPILKHKRINYMCRRESISLTVGNSETDAAGKPTKRY